ncbi:hypothetical protein GW590_10000 [Rahnella sp. SAP-1]|uniref:Uncharacterized protein n=1 Tax=Rouxiella aceris TaxID=2703884 RepID=A0A848MIR6_9GAMM|nr:hypothetical protein [Rouxiella aceris]NMP27196.1 hypothetical protein [Rouxiella aceris]
MLQQANAVQTQQGVAASQNTQSEYHYQVDIGQLPQCPPATALALNKDGWRFTSNPLTNNCFAPALKKSPARSFSSPSQACSMWGLSMYESEAEAKDAYAKLKKSIKNIKKVIGDHLSVGQLTVDDGKCTQTGSNGHFDFHPFVNVPFTQKFHIVCQLP